MQLVKLSLGIGRIDQTFYGSSRDRSNFQRAMWNLARISVELSGIGLFFAREGGLNQTFCQKRWDWSNFLLEEAPLGTVLHMSILKYFVVHSVLCMNKRIMICNMSLCNLLLCLSDCFS